MPPDVILGANIKGCVLPPTKPPAGKLVHFLHFPCCPLWGRNRQEGRLGTAAA